jgi:hypothetical protein
MANLQHGNKLEKSIPDTITLAAKVEENFLTLCELHRRVRGVDLIPPRELDGDMLNWRAMRVRHKKGDFRNTESELRSTKTIAEWTVQVNCVLRNQPPKHVTWKEEVGLS